MSTRPVNRKGTIPLRERLTLADQWREFERVIPKDAPQVQRVESRRAWYAGAAAMFGLLSGGFDTNDSEPTELDLEYVTSIQQELHAFAVDLGRGRA